MALRTISIRASSSSPTIRHRANLDGTDYLFELQWNGAEGRWYLHLFTANGDPIALGLKLVAGARLGHRSADSRMPPGVLGVIDSSGEGRDPGIDDFANGRVALVYVDAEGVAA
jgi:hypothetical protein